MPKLTSPLHHVIASHAPPTRPISITGDRSRDAGVAEVCKYFVAVKCPFASPCVVTARRFGAGSVLFATLVLLLRLQTREAAGVAGCGVGMGSQGREV